MPDTPQENFLSSSADVAALGGGAGSGKSYGLLMEALRHIGNSGFGAVLFRRTNEDIRNEGALWDTSKEIYSGLARPREANLDWRFPSGASISFKGLQYMNDVYNFQGSQICLMGFDELVHFLERQFWYMISRNRSTCGVRPYIRVTFNPDPDSWVFNLFGPWVNPEHPNYGAKPGELRYFVRRNDETIWCEKDEPDCKSITYFPALVYDNPILMEKDPGYLANLKALSHEDQERLLHGSWAAIESKDALWTRANISRDRVQPGQTPLFKRVVVSVDPATTSKAESDETGIVVAAEGMDGHGYTLADLSGIYKPGDWAKVAVSAFHRFNCSCIVAEKNQGGEMIETTLHTVERVPVKLVHVHDSKELRAEPVSALSTQGRDHHVGNFPALEGEMTRWVPNSNMPSPNRLDAKVQAYKELGLVFKPAGGTAIKSKPRVYV